MIGEEFQEAWIRYFSPAARGHASLSDFEGEVDGWLPDLNEVGLPTLSAGMLLDVAKKKSMTAGVWMVGVGEILRPFLCPGIMILLIYCVQLMKTGVDLKIC